MRGFLLILGLLMAVALAFVMGVFVGVRYDGAGSGSPEVAQNDTGADRKSGRDGDGAGEQRAESASDAPSDRAGAAPAPGDTTGNGGGGGARESASGTAAAGSAGNGDTGGAARAQTGGTGGNDGDSDGTGANGGGGDSGTWLSDAAPEPGDSEAVGGEAVGGEAGASGELAAGSPGPPDVLTPTETQPGAPVYAVETVHAVPRHRAVDLARRLDGERASAQVIPVFAADTQSGTPGDTARSHVRLAAFAERASAAAAAERGMRELDVRLRVVRVRRPAGAGGSGKGAESADPTSSDTAGPS